MHVFFARMRNSLGALAGPLCFVDVSLCRTTHVTCTEMMYDPPTRAYSVTTMTQSPLGYWN